jgi:hypothetical protein
VIVERGPLDACALGLEQTWVQTERLFYMLRSFLTGGVSPQAARRADPHRQHGLRGGHAATAWPSSSTSWRSCR